MKVIWAYVLEMSSMAEANLVLFGDQILPGRLVGCEEFLEGKDG